jgi:hypothetical protein
MLNPEAGGLFAVRVKPAKPEAAGPGRELGCQRGIELGTRLTTEINS